MKGHVHRVIGRAIGILSAVAAVGCGPQESQKPPPATLAITQVTLIDGTGNPARNDVTVLVDGDRIVAVGLSQDLVPDEKLPTIDGRGRFLIPGLWDSHVHLAFDAKADIEPSRQLALYLAHGVVGVRDMGSDRERILALRQRIAAGEIPGPEIVSSGPFVDGPQEAQPAVLPVADADAARQAVRSLRAMGVDFVKVQAKLSKPAYMAVIDEARSVGLPVHGHVPDALSAAEVSNAGQRTIEHVSPALPSDAALLFNCSSREVELRQELAEIQAARGSADPAELAERNRALQLDLVESYSEAKAEALFGALKQNGTRVVPTLVWSRAFSPPAEDWPEDLPRHLLPPEARQRWEGIYERFFGNATADRLALNQQVAAGSSALVGALHQAGVRVLAGTDSLFGFVLPGFALHQELELLVAAGLSPAEALSAATRGPAELLGVLDERGTVEVGKIADLVLLEADPLADIRNTRRIVAVVDGGQVRSRADLDRMLSDSDADNEAKTP